ncbi:hypothetical protein ACJJTC_016689 [Scirpophaga incertulas]
MLRIFPQNNQGYLERQKNHESEETMERLKRKGPQLESILPMLTVEASNTSLMGVDIEEGGLCKTSIYGRRCTARLSETERISSSRAPGTACTHAYVRARAVRRRKP